VITKATNEAIQEVLYNSGLVANETYSLRHEIESITANDIQTGADAESSVFYQGRDTITTFDEFELFTGLTIVPSYCFAYLAKMTRIKLPATITSVAANAFLN
jgi:hypothetical protein